MKDKVTYNNLVRISKKLDNKKNKEWDDLVESLYINYLISIIEGSIDEENFKNVYINLNDYTNQYTKFYESIDSELEESLPDIVYGEEEISIGD